MASSPPQTPHLHFCLSLCSCLYIYVCVWMLMYFTYMNTSRPPQNVYFTSNEYVVWKTYSVVTYCVVDVFHIYEHVTSPTDIFCGGRDVFIYVKYILCGGCDRRIHSVVTHSETHILYFVVHVIETHFLTETHSVFCGGCDRHTHILWWHILTETHILYSVVDVTETDIFCGDTFWQRHTLCILWLMWQRHTSFGGCDRHTHSVVVSMDVNSQMWNMNTRIWNMNGCEWMHVKHEYECVHGCETWVRGREAWIDGNKWTWNLNTWMWNMNGCKYVDVKHKYVDVKHEYVEVKHEYEHVHGCGTWIRACETCMDVNTGMSNMSTQMWNIWNFTCEIHMYFHKRNTNVFSHVKYEYIDVKHECIHVKHEYMDVKHEYADVKHEYKYVDGCGTWIRHVPQGIISHTWMRHVQ